MGQPIYQVDAFTSERFKGNPAAVCVIDEGADETWMQQVATEMNLAETSYLLPTAEGYQLRWFTPRLEVDLCGHATIAASHILWEIGMEAPDAVITFHTRSGRLTARRIDGWIELDFPAEPDFECPAPDGLLESLGISGGEVRHLGKNRFDYLVQLESAAVVYVLQPNFTELERISCRGIIVTAESDVPDRNFISRFFAPAAGIAEDPVTGSAHCCLAPFWCDRLGKAKLLGYQASARGGYVRVELAGDRVLLGGQAVTTLRGELV